MDDPTEDDDPLVKLTSLGVVGVGLAALFLGYDWFWVAFVIGFAVLVPLVKLASDEFGLGPETERESTERNASPARADAPESKRDALDTLRDRYARGELSEDEFERKAEALLETETLEGAREYVERGRAPTEANPDAPTESDSDDPTEADSDAVRERERR